MSNQSNSKGQTASNNEIFKEIFFQVSLVRFGCHNGVFWMFFHPDKKKILEETFNSLDTTREREIEEEVKQDKYQKHTHRELIKERQCLERAE